MKRLLPLAITIVASGCGAEAPPVLGPALELDAGPSAEDAGLAPELDGGRSTEDAGPGSPPVDQARVEGGGLQGVRAEGAVAFLGVPYARPPLGDLRWRLPQAPEPWAELRPADTMSSECVQPTGVGGNSLPPGGSFGEEDCLYLNLWKPASEGAARPVLVFLHGGGNFAGSTREPLRSVMTLDSDAPLYDGARLAAGQDVIVVTINYRLGALGFLALDALDAESDTGTSGNYGLMDQIAALEWVQRNVAAFGGDPQRVLLFGQSGGGRDVALLATSPRTDGLFSAAVIHSAPLGVQPQTELRARAQALATEVGCAAPNLLACLRETDPGALVTAEASQPLGLASAAFLPSIDGHVVEGVPAQIIGRGDYRGTPLMLGTLEVEYSHRWENVTAGSYANAVAALAGARFAPRILEQYPIERFGDAREALTTLMSDRNVTCPYRAFARIVASAGVPTWLYRFRQELPAPVRWGWSAYHTSELVYLFQHPYSEGWGATDDDRRTADVMARYWARFAMRADPNGADDPSWSRFTSAQEAYLSLEAEPYEDADLKSEDCDFWAGLR